MIKKIEFIQLSLLIRRVYYDDVAPYVNMVWSVTNSGCGAVSSKNIIVIITKML